MTYTLFSTTRATAPPPTSSRPPPRRPTIAAAAVVASINPTLDRHDLFSRPFLFTLLYPLGRKRSPFEGAVTKSFPIQS